MPKSGRTTTEEGYGWTHQQARARLLAQLQQDGEGRCCRCTRTIYPEQAATLDADHWQTRKDHGEPPDALAHRRCNRQAGARAGNRRRRSRSSNPDDTASAIPLPQW